MIKIELNEMYAKILLESINSLIDSINNKMSKKCLLDKDWDKFVFYNLVLNICAQSIENAINKE